MSAYLCPGDRVRYRYYDETGRNYVYGNVTHAVTGQEAPDNDDLYVKIQWEDGEYTTESAAESEYVQLVPPF